MPETQKIKEIEMTVMRVENLPETFRPLSTSTEATAKLPDPLADLVQEATSGLTDAERGAFLQRLHEERPEVFCEETDGHPNITRKEWREKLIRWLKEEANRFMAAAASL